MAKEYIERDALINEINLQRKSSKTSYPKLSFVVGDVLTCIYTAPAADVVEVVRCKDCKYRANGWSNESFCGKRVGGMSATAELKDDDFCSYGERRDD